MYPQQLSSNDIAKLNLNQIVIFPKPPNIIATNISRFTVHTIPLFCLYLTIFTIIRSTPYLTLFGYTCIWIWMFVCWSLTSLCHSNRHIETMPAREINPFTALTRIRSQFLRTQWSTSNHSEWTRLRIKPLSHRGWLIFGYGGCTSTI